MKARVRAAAGLLAALLTGCGITAPSHNPGYAHFDPSAYPGLTRDTAVSLGPRLLRFAARHAADREPDTEALLGAVSGVRFAVYSIDEAVDHGALLAHLDETAGLLDTDWRPVVRVRKPQSRVHILVKQSQDAILGLAVISFDGDELAFVNVMGQFTPAMLAALPRGWDSGQTDAFRHSSLR